MRRHSLEVLACPQCGARLRGDRPGQDPIESGSLLCPSGHSFPVVSGIPYLIPEAVRDGLRAFGTSYADAWSRDGWGSTDLDDLRDLPYRDRTRRHSAEWRVKARSMEALLSVLPTGRPLAVADLGCGMGWLAHYLALAGHDVFALDATLDARIGLGAAGAYVRLGPPFERIWGEIGRPPFASGSLDAAVCNASLHYLSGVDEALARIAQTLRPGGFLVVMNSPVCRDAASASRGESEFRKRLEGLGATAGVASRYHHFVRSRLESSIQSAVGPVREVPFDPGTWFRWSRKAKGLVLGMELASFPVLIAEKPREPP